MERAADAVVQALTEHGDSADRSDFSSRVHDALSRFLYDETRLRPLILPVRMEV
jgi:mRNA degradation ribonuclease J1/J2